MGYFFSKEIMDFTEFEDIMHAVSFSKKHKTEAYRVKDWSTHLWTFEPFYQR
jgi:hypothetical protein